MVYLGLKSLKSINIKRSLYFGVKKGIIVVDFLKRKRGMLSEANSLFD
jgi:hypothetical protein